jgi:hypothetical protein
MGNASIGHSMVTIRRFKILPLALALLAGGAAVGVYAQIEGNADRGVPPIDSVSNFEVGGIMIDIAGKSADAVRKRGWREAQRKGWQLLWKKLHGGNGPGLSDGALDSMVSGIIIEDEQISEHRYVARLGITFDRVRASEVLGVAGKSRRSAPLLLLPIMWDGGVAQSYETRTEWQKAWARFRTDESPMDYVRAIGTGADPLILNVAQTTRPGRKWWRSLLDQYGAVDVLIAQVQIVHDYPGGPITGHFSARYGPDNRIIQNFSLRVNSSAALPQLMAEGVKRMDAVYASALASGMLKPDTSLILEQIITEEEIEAPAPEETKATTKPTEAGVEREKTSEIKEPPKEVVPPPSQIKTITIQVDTPDVGAVMEAESTIRGVPGVKSASTVSTAVGGVSVVRVTFDGDADMLRVALSSRGYQVSGGGTSLRIDK